MEIIEKIPVPNSEMSPKKRKGSPRSDLKRRREEGGGGGGGGGSTCKGQRVSSRVSDENSRVPKYPDTRDTHTD